MAMKPKIHPPNGNGYSSDNCGGGGGCGNTSPSPPPSPPRHSHFRRRVKSKVHYVHSLKESFGGGYGILFRPNLLLLSLLYVSGLLMCVGPFSAYVSGPTLPGSFYHSHEMFRRLRRDIEADNSSVIEVHFHHYIFGIPWQDRMFGVREENT